MSEPSTNKPDDPFAALVVQVEADPALHDREPAVDRLLLRAISAAVLIALDVYASPEDRDAAPAVRLRQRLTGLDLHLPWLRPLDSDEYPDSITPQTASLLLSPLSALQDEAPTPLIEPMLDLLDRLYASNLNRTYRLLAGQVPTDHAAAAYLLDHTLNPGLQTFADEVRQGTFRILDPTCGSGVILAAALQRIIGHLASDGGDLKRIAPRALAMVCGADLDGFCVELSRLRVLLAMIQAGVAPEAELLAAIGAQVQILDTLLPWERLGTEDLPPAHARILAAAEIDPARQAAHQRFLGQPFHVIAADLPDGSFRGHDDIYSVLWPVSCPPVRRPRQLVWHDRLEGLSTGSAFFGREAPFLERVFTLGSPGAFVGVITPDGFASVAYGKGVVEEVLPRWDLTQLIVPDAPISTGPVPCIMLLGRCLPPQADRIEAILSRDLQARAVDKDEPIGPAAASFFAEVAALERGDRLLSTQIARRDLAHHPWDLAALIRYPIEKIHVRGFKSLVDISLPLGRLNVFIGANGSGKSNLLEAVGLLGGAAFGRVDLESLARRGVRPGLARLYASAFVPTAEGAPPEISLSAGTGGDSYQVVLRPGASPSEWIYAEELLSGRGQDVAARSLGTLSFAPLLQELAQERLPAQGSVDLRPSDGISQLMRLLRQKTGTLPALLDTLESFVIYTPFTPMLRGTTPDPSQIEPIGLSGGRLGDAVQAILAEPGPSAVLQRSLRQLIDWSDDMRVGSAEEAGLSPGVATTRSVLRFHDRYMKGGPEWLSGFDASEGALYVAFLLTLVLHPRAPRIVAVDNADQSLNPRLARALIEEIQGLLLADPLLPQLMMTVHNPPVLDSLELADDRVRLFVLGRRSDGPTTIRRVEHDEALAQARQAGMTLSELWVTGMLGGLPNI